MSVSLPNSIEQNPFWKLNRGSATHEIAAIYGTPNSITMSSQSRHLTLLLDKRIHSTFSHLISLRSISLLYYHLFLGPLSGLFPSRFPTKILYAFLICPMRATCSVNLNLLICSYKEYLD